MPSAGLGLADGHHRTARLERLASHSLKEGADRLYERFPQRRVLIFIEMDAVDAAARRHRTRIEEGALQLNADGPSGAGISTGLKNVASTSNVVFKAKSTPTITGLSPR